jgi:hypothetical protein
VDQQVAQHHREAVQILLGAEGEHQHLAGRIVDRADQGQAGLLGTQPEVVAAVDQYHAAFARTSFAPPVMARRAALLGRLQAQSLADPPHTVIAHRQALLRQQVDDVAIVQAHRLVVQQRLHAPSQRLFQPLGRRPSPVAVQQPGRTVGGDPPLEPHHLPDAQPERPSQCAAGALSSQRGFDQTQPPCIPDSHENVVHGGDTLTAELGGDRITAEQHE